MYVSSLSFVNILNMGGLFMSGRWYSCINNEAINFVIMIVTCGQQRPPKQIGVMTLQEYANKIVNDRKKYFRMQKRSLYGYTIAV